MALSHGKFQTSWGVFLLAIAAVLYGLYEVLYRKFAVKEGRAPLALANFILGGIGATHLFCFWIFFIPLNYSGLEKFELPSAATTGRLFLNAFLAMAFNWSFMLCLVLLPSPVLVNVAVLLTIPASDITDLLVHSASFSGKSIGGTVLICIGFILLTFESYREEKARRQRLVGITEVAGF
eukprot:m.24480 g.24480  ORF g.24480 m.24480 type:complete len:180 (+) comp13389_c0_seq2:594-1133(+)